MMAESIGRWSTRGLLFAALTVGLCAVPTASGWAATPVQDPELSPSQRFEVELDAARASLSKRRWEQAEESLLALLADHAGATYVLPHVQSLREDLRHAAFWKDLEEPDPNELITGRLLRYSAGSANVKLRYDHDSLGDFEQSGLTRIHPMHFADTWTIHIRGTPQEISRSTYVVYLGGNEGYSLKFGMRDKDAVVFFRHQVNRFKGMTSTSIASEDPKELRGNKAKIKIKAKIVVGRKTIRMSYNGRKVVQIRRQEDEAGQFGLTATKTLPFGSVTLEGEIEPGWIGGILDAAVAEQRAVFDKNWKDPELFSAWDMVENVAAEEVSFAQLLKRLKFTMSFDHTSQQESFESAEATLAKFRLQAVSTLRQLDDWAEGTTSPSALNYLRFNLSLELDHYSRALVHFQKLETDPENALDRQLFKAELLRLAGQVEDAHAAYSQLAKDNPAVSLTHLGEAETLLLLGRPEDAHKAILRGLTQLPTSESLHALETKIVKADKGPSWKRMHEDVGTHFVVRTNVNTKVCEQARRVLDKAWQRCEEFFGPLPTEHPGLSVAYLFSGEAGYAKYVQGIADSGHENTLGVYSAYLKQIAAWNQPSADDLWDTLRHEVAHRYLDLAIGERIPRWLNEGLAECFAASWNSEGEYEPGGMRRRAWATLSANPEYLSIYDFMTNKEAKFMERAELNYAQAWALVHYLRFGVEAEQELLRRLMTDLKNGADPLVATDSLLASTDVEKLQAKFIKWAGENVQAHRRGR